ncbi:predicted protein [Botrytis cinerea T4]|uniref:Uncharacterized protein n=1 Tax=Botryotinia fuckeliana (strain T4) TaxID=999810 RepID=G2XR41_BOTF4|nr:predicted protein [Botrytis cinerea T4]
MPIRGIESLNLDTHVELQIESFNTWSSIARPKLTLTSLQLSGIYNHPKM